MVVLSRGRHGRAGDSGARLGDIPKVGYWLNSTISRDQLRHSEALTP